MPLPSPQLAVSPLLKLKVATGREKLQFLPLKDTLKLAVPAFPPGIPEILYTMVEGVLPVVNVPAARVAVKPATPVEVMVCAG